MGKLGVHLNELEREKILDYIEDFGPKYSETSLKDDIVSFESFSQMYSALYESEPVELDGESAGKATSECPEINPDLINLDIYDSDRMENAIISENTDIGSLEVIFYRRDKEDTLETAYLLDEGEYSESMAYELTAYLDDVYPHIFNELLDSLDGSGFIKSSRMNPLSTSTAGIGLSFLDSIDLVERWGSENNSVYQVDAGKAEIYDAWRKTANTNR